MERNPPPEHEEITQPDFWVDRYGDYLFSYAVQRVNDRVAAEDIVQDTFLAALGAWKNFKGQSKVRTWLTGILKHKIIDYFRKKYRELPQDHIELTADLANTEFDEKGEWKNKPSKWSHDPRKLLEQREFMEIIHKCIAGLSSRLASAFTLRELEDESTEQICKVLNISSTNCWVMLHRARSLMRRCLEKKWLGAKR